MGSRDIYGGLVNSVTTWGQGDLGPWPVTGVKHNGLRIRYSEYSQVSATSWFSDFDQESLSTHYGRFKSTNVFQFAE